MAITYAGNMGGGPAIINRFQIEETCYVGQILEITGGSGGHCRVLDNAAAGPDTANPILGLCVGVYNSPTYDSTYQGDKATLDTSQAAQTANDPVGPTEVDVVVLRPGDLIRCPIAKDTIGTALDELTPSSSSATGLTVAHTATAIQDIPDDYSTIYCRSGANRGQYRVITTGATKTQTVTVAFTYDVATTDKYVACAVTLGACRIEFDSQKQAIDGNDDGAEYFAGYCHELNLETSGQEYAVISLHPQHLWG